MVQKFPQGLFPHDGIVHFPGLLWHRPWISERFCRTAVCVFEVTDSEGNPISNAKIYAKLDENEVYWSDSTVTEADGIALMFINNPDQVQPVFSVEAEGYTANGVTDPLPFGKTSVVLNKAE